LSGQNDIVASAGSFLVINDNRFNNGSNNAIFLSGPTDAVVNGNITNGRTINLTVSNFVTAVGNNTQSRWRYLLVRS
jgi:hypothetical protein